jgi:hypothetical protein
LKLQESSFRPKAAHFAAAVEKSAVAFAVVLAFAVVFIGYASSTPFSVWGAVHLGNPRL